MGSGRFQLPRGESHFPGKHGEQNHNKWRICFDRTLKRMDWDTRLLLVLLALYMALHG